MLSIYGETTVARNYGIKVEYASTAITQDLRADDTAITTSNLAIVLFNNKTST